MNFSYIDQAKRMFRSFKRLPDNPSKFTDHDWDDYYHFFQDAYHLKEWIANDENNAVSNKMLNEFIEKEPEIKLLQTVVTNLKHFKITVLKTRFSNIRFEMKEEKSIPYPSIAYEEEGYLMINDKDYLLLENGGKIIISSEEKEIHPKELAVKVIEAWLDFLKQQVLEGNLKLVKDWDLKKRENIEDWLQLLA